MSSDWFASTGTAGWAIVAVGALLLIVGVVAAVVRVSPLAAIVLLLSCALPLLVGVAGMFVGRAQRAAPSEVRIENLVAPAPADLRGDRRDPTTCLYLGLATMLVCDTVAIAALLRARKPEPPTG